jgi:hypothetical protein
MEQVHSREYEPVTILHEVEDVATAAYEKQLHREVV